MTQQATNLVPLDDSPTPGAMITTEQVQAQLGEMHRLVDAVLLSDVHYGVIPGTSSKSLLKPGAEILFKAFMCQPRHHSEVVEIDRANRYVMISVRCEAVHVPSGVVMSEGLGAATSEKWIDNKVDFGWLYNAALKMAAKRAFVDCALKIGAVSAHFTQDMEDWQPGEESAPYSGNNGGAPDLFNACPLHNSRWYDGRFGRYHKKDGGGFCNFKDVAKVTLEEAAAKAGVTSKEVDALIKRRYMSTWSKINDREKCDLIDAVLDGEAKPGVQVNQASGEVTDPADLPPAGPVDVAPPAPTPAPAQEAPAPATPAPAPAAGACILCQHPESEHRDGYCEACDFTDAARHEYEGPTAAK